MNETLQKISEAYGHLVVAVTVLNRPKVTEHSEAILELVRFLNDEFGETATPPPLKAMDGFISSYNPQFPGDEGLE